MVGIIILPTSYSSYLDLFGLILRHTHIHHEKSNQKGLVWFRALNMFVKMT